MAGRSNFTESPVGVSGQNSDQKFEIGFTQGQSFAPLNGEIHRIIPALIDSGWLK